MNLTLRVQSLAANSLGEYDIAWRITSGPFANQRQGVRVELTSSGPRWSQLTCVQTTCVANAKSITGHVQPGAPGALTWIVPREEYRLFLNTTIDGFQAASRVSGANRNAAASVDQATGVRPYTYPEWPTERHLTLDAMDVPTEAPLLTDPAFDVPLAHHDVLAFWLTIGNRTDESTYPFEATYRLRSFNLTRDPACSLHARLNFNTLGGGTSVDVDARLRLDTRTIPEEYHVQVDVSPRALGSVDKLVALEGAPAYLRVIGNFSGGEKRLDPHDLGIYVTVDCLVDPGRFDEIRQRPNPLPAPGLLAATMAALVAVWSVRRRNRS